MAPAVLPALPRNSLTVSCGRGRTARKRGQKLGFMAADAGPRSPGIARRYRF